MSTLQLGWLASDCYKSIYYSESWMELTQLRLCLWPTNLRFKSALEKPWPEIHTGMLCSSGWGCLKGQPAQANKTCYCFYLSRHIQAWVLSMRSSSFWRIIIYIKYIYLRTQILCILWTWHHCMPTIKYQSRELPKTNRSQWCSEMILNTIWQLYWKDNSGILNIEPPFWFV